MAGNDNRDYGRETRDTVVKSSLTGVGLTVLAVAALSPAGFGGMIGSSVASALGNEHVSAKSDPYANLPPFPNLLTRNEVDDIHGQLAATAAAMEITRAATDDRIELVRELAMTPGRLSVAPARRLAKMESVAPLPRTAVVAPTRSAPVASTPARVSAPRVAAPVQPVPVADVAPVADSGSASSPAAIAPISFIDSPLDPQLELASLLLGDN